MKHFGDGRDRFFENRLGMFVHWGLYALPAWHEQILWRGAYPRHRYEKLVDSFNPTAFDPERWLDLVEAAGMTYICFTTKHHDGFCMYDSAHTDYKITHTPYGRDVLSELAEACHRRGILLSLYYSLPDWHHPNCPNWGRHHEMFGPRPDDDPDEERYLEFVEQQIRELCTNYGEIYQFFWDVNVAGYSDPRFNEVIRSLQPGILINDRGPSPGDYSTPERHVPEGMVFQSPTEACQSVGRESWGFREEEDYYTDSFLLHSIDKILSMGGNYLLNVGPKPDGSIPDEAASLFSTLGGWYGRVREAFTNTLPAGYVLSTDETNRSRYDNLLITRSRHTLYAHSASGLSARAMVLPGVELEPAKVTLLNSGEPLQWRLDTLPWRWQQKPCLRVLDVPADTYPSEPLVVKIEFPELVAS